MRSLFLRPPPRLLLRLLQLYTNFVGRYGRGPLTPRDWKSTARQAAIEQGIRRMIEPSDDGAGVWGTRTRVDVYLEGLLEAYERCGKDVFMKKVEHKQHGPSYQAARLLCHATGHEACAWEHAQRDLAKWEHAFAASYGEAPLAVIEFHAPGLGPRAMRKSVDQLKRRRPLAALLGKTVGYIKPAEHGSVYSVLVRRSTLRLLPLALRIWREEVPGGRVRVRRVAGWARAIDAAAELRVEAEQAPLLLAGLAAEGSELPGKVREWLAEALADGAPRAHTPHRVRPGILHVWPSGEDWVLCPTV